MAEQTSKKGRRVAVRLIAEGHEHRGEPVPKGATLDLRLDQAVRLIEAGRGEPGDEAAAREIQAYRKEGSGGETGT